MRLGIAVGCLFLTTSAFVGLDMPGTVAVSALFLQTGLSSVVLERPSAALLLGVSGWALCTGFAINQLGELTFTSADLARLAAYTAWALTCCWLGAPQ